MFVVYPPTLSENGHIKGICFIGPLTLCLNKYINLKMFKMFIIYCLSKLNIKNEKNNKSSDYLQNI